ncbi:hypothetical protein LTR66_005305 [Elasticomyces elasticus]|nr:hypothetical protein LTR50_000104 [Elasticomyces elasticus]KAK4994729.1 hypothetical protein LTR66_005305 [Elasticomyces elasticus]
MESYPTEYTTHNLPLILLFGLANSNSELDSEKGSSQHENGSRITRTLPLIQNQRTDALLQEFRHADASDHRWHQEFGNHVTGFTGYKIRSAGRSFVFPIRKAAPASKPSSYSPPNSPTEGSLPSGDLHSPLSPLSPGSPIFPDGLFTPLWLRKHQQQVPSVVVSFFEILATPNTSATQDNQLKLEINSLKNSLLRSGYKTRFVAVLVSDRPAVEAPELEERIANIKRATGLDLKTSLFLLPPTSSRAELSAFVTSVLSVLQTTCVDYYRDLTKHSRRKKGRSYVPSPTVVQHQGTSQILSDQGWNARYEFKQGIFAEFRQEMDVAERHYALAIEELFSSEGVLETTPSWSPRWNDARLLADVVALRTLRCQIWRDMTTGAVQSWLNYRDRVKDLIDQRGKGSQTYGWEAWEARWSTIMAQIIERADLRFFRSVSAAENTTQDELERSQQAIYALPEKVFSAVDRLPPFHFLHHPGYWYRLSAKSRTRRRKLAEDMPDEDRTPPGQSPASQVVNRFRTYDTYLVPEPHIEAPLQGSEGFDHCSDIVEALEQCRKHLSSHNQRRFADTIGREIGHELARAGRYDQALNLLRPLWKSMTWREEQWRDCVEDFLWLLHSCAVHVKDAEVLLAVEYELLHKHFPKREGHTYALMHCLDAIAEYSGPKPDIDLTNDNSASFLSVTCAFASGEDHVGESVATQVVIRSEAQPGSAPIVLSEAVILFEGCVAQVHIGHNPDTGPDANGTESVIRSITLLEGSGASGQRDIPSFFSSSDLSFHPGQTKVFQFALCFRNAGDAVATQVMLSINSDRLALRYTTTLKEVARTALWWLKSDHGLASRRISRQHPSMIRVLPKPPRMRISMPDVREIYYTGEKVFLVMRVINEESETADATVSVRILGHEGNNLEFTWINDIPPATAEHDLPGLSLGKLDPLSDTVQTLAFTAPPESATFMLSVKVLYQLTSDMINPISKSYTTELSFVNPFEANYDFMPRVHYEPWPCFFSAPTARSERSAETVPFQNADGIVQHWALTSRVTSFATEDLVIENIDLKLDQLSDATLCTISSTDGVDTGHVIAPQGLESANFSIETRKLALEDRRSSVLDLSLAITWRRTKALGQAASPPVTAESVTTILPVSRLVANNAEPRVLCSTAALSSSLPPTNTAVVTYWIENPSMHFLTFALTMEASEEFAFSGSKYRTLSVAPVSRVSVEFRLLVLGRDDAVDGKDGSEREGQGKWVWPVLRVVDSFFQRGLRVLPASDGVKTDGKGGIGVWIPTG